MFFKLDGPDLGLTNGIDSVETTTAGISELTFEEEEEEQFCIKDLPKHACRFVTFCLIIIFIE